MSDSTSPPLANDPAARTPTGEILDQSTLTPTTTSPDSTTTSPSAKPGDTAAPAVPATAPESYTFKTPEGQTLNQALVDDATPVFRELGLTQAQADKLTTIWNKHAAADATRAQDVIRAQGEKWDAELKADPVMGPKLDAIKTDIGRALDHMAPATRTKFQTAMNLTMAGNNPDIVRGFHELAQRVIEGKHVTGNGASPEGQRAPGTSARPSLAAAMYPNLAASSRAS